MGRGFFAFRLLHALLGRPADDGAAPLRSHPGDGLAAVGRGADQAFFRPRRGVGGPPAHVRDAPADHRRSAADPGKSKITVDFRQHFCYTEGCPTMEETAAVPQESSSREKGGPLPCAASSMATPSPPPARYAPTGRRSSDGNAVLCSRKGVMPLYHHCRRFEYDPLRRIPTRPKGPGKFDEDDFRLD